MTSLSKLAVLAAALSVSLAVQSAAAEPIRILTPSQIRSQGGTVKDFAVPVVIVTEPEWQEYDLRLIEAENKATRFEAENRILREEAETNWPVWILVPVALAAGIFAGTQF